MPRKRCRIAGLKKGKNAESFTPAQIIAAVAKCDAGAYAVAKRLGCSVRTLFNYRERYPDVDEAFIAKRGEVIDAAERSLYKAAADGEAWAVCFLLKTQAKDRGYVE